MNISFKTLRNRIFIGIFIAMMNPAADDEDFPEGMDFAIDLVKQARDAFS